MIQIERSDRTILMNDKCTTQITYSKLSLIINFLILIKNYNWFIQEQKNVIEERLSRIQSQGGEAVAKSEEEIVKLQEINASLKIELANAKENITYEQEKLKSMELTISNLTSGQDEIIAREKQAAEDRAEQQRVKDQQHAQELRELEGTIQANEIKMKYEMSQAKGKL